MIAGMEDIQTIVDALSERRIEPLRRMAGDNQSALEAYEWEMRLQQCLLKPICLTEVVIRNSIDNSIKQWWDENVGGGCWTDSNVELPERLELLFHVASWKKKTAKRLCKPVGTVTHDDLIAHSGLGIWKSVIGNPAYIPSEPPGDVERQDSWNARRLGDSRCAELWKDVTSHAFPNVPAVKHERGGMSRRGYIGARLTRVANLRNRICHWDNLLLVNIEERYLDCAQLLDAVNPVLSKWIHGLCDEEIEAVISSRPDWV